ncbi:MAG: DUF63 family protein [Candidatus Bilamarchaeaceae archaeon]
MKKFIYDYFIDPIWSRTGYNLVNTSVYVVMALAAVYAIFKLFKKIDITIDRRFMFALLPFILFGSTVRVITDSIDSDVFKPITPVHAFVLQSHIYDYGYLTVTPGIYIVTALIFLLSVLLLRFLGRMEDLWKVGTTLWLPHLLLLLPFMGYWYLAFVPIVLAIVPWAVAKKILKDDILAGIVFAHALDGSATFFALSGIFEKLTGIRYFEQHVVSSALINITGDPIAFYFLKILLSFAAAYALAHEKMPEDEKVYISVVLITVGLAPGIRDTARIMVGA